MSGMCQYDADCPAALVCYSNVSWYEPGPDGNGCGCSTFYGFSGPTCELVLQTSTSKYWLGMGIIIILIQSSIFVVSLYQMGRMIKNHFSILRAEFVAILQLWFGSIFAIVAQVGVTWAAQSPASAQFIRGAVTNDKENDLHHVWQALCALSGIFQISAGLTVALVWIDVAIKASKLYQSRSGEVMSYQKRLAIFQMTFIIVFIVPISLDYQRISVALTYVLELVLVATYIVGNIMMTRVIRSIAEGSSRTAPPRPASAITASPIATENSSRGLLPTSSSNQTAQNGPNNYDRVIREIRLITIIICAWVVMASICNTILFITMLLGWKEISWLDPLISLQVMVFLLMVFSVSAGAGCILVFLKNSTDRLLKRKQTNKNLVVPVVE